MRSSGNGTLALTGASSVGAPRLRRWKWVVFDPPLRDPVALSATQFEVSCRVCGTVLGRAEDPVAALGLAWRNRSHPRRHPRLLPRSS